MKKVLTSICFAFLAAIVIFSCSKNDDPSPSNASAIQHKWIFDSIVVYSNSQLTGPGYFGMIGNNSDYFNFSSNGKVYTQMQNSYDSGTYRVDGDQLYMNTYYSGQLSVKTDTVSIRVINNNSLILVKRNEVGDYGKFCFKK
jgi:hypothetical protein